MIAHPSGDSASSRIGEGIPGFTRALLAGLPAPMMVLVGLLLAGPVVATSQTLPAQPAFIVEGRVVEKHAAVGVSDVTVELEGEDGIVVGATAPDGRFRFENVRPGGYTLRLLGTGYRPRLQYVYVDEDVGLILPLAASPPLDGAARRFRRQGHSPSGVSGRGRLRGVVRAGEWGLPLRGVEVLTDRGVAARSGSHGEFAVQGLPAGSAVLVSLRAFGYLPLDTAVVIDGSESHDFQMWRDPAVQRRIDEKVQGLERRAALHPGAVRTLSREALLASHRPTLGEVIRSHHGEETIRRIRCVVLDDDPGHPPGVLSTMAPGDLQRVELLSDPGGSGDTVARIYTRRFIRDLVGGGLEAESSTVAYVEGVAEAGSGPWCGGVAGDGPC